MLEIQSIDGEPPNRVIRIVRYADYTTSEYWHRQNKRVVEITESELRAWTDDLPDRNQWRKPQSRDIIQGNRDT
ncbi:hypothetical protein [Nocardia jiangxiensis]|nr:hypothetical protein [Nocardia jiangxiensis]